MLEEPAPLFGAQAECGIDQALPDHDMALAEARGELRHVLQADAAAVDQVLVLTAAEGASRDGHLSELCRQPPLGVIEDERSLGHARGGTPLPAGKDHLFGLAGTQCCLALLAKDPAQGIRDVRFAGTIGTDDRSDAWLKNQGGAVQEALESLNFQLGEPRRAEVAGISGHHVGTFPARSIGLMGNLSGTGADGTIALRTEQRGWVAFGRRERPVDRSPHSSAHRATRRPARAGTTPSPPWPFHRRTVSNPD